MFPEIGGVRGVPADGELESYNVIDKNLPPGQFLGTVQGMCCRYGHRFSRDNTLINARIRVSVPAG